MYATWRVKINKKNTICAFRFQRWDAAKKLALLITANFHQKYLYKNCEDLIILMLFSGSCFKSKVRFLLQKSLLSYKHTERQRSMLVNGDAWKSVPDFQSVTIDQHWPLTLKLGLGILLRDLLLFCVHQKIVRFCNGSKCDMIFLMKIQLQSITSEW